MEPWLGMGYLLLSAMRRRFMVLDPCYRDLCGGKRAIMK